MERLIYAGDVAPRLASLFTVRAATTPSRGNHRRCFTKIRLRNVPIDFARLEMSPGYGDTCTGKLTHAARRFSHSGLRGVSLHHANRLFQPFTLYPIVCSSVRTRSACVPWISNPSSVIVPPAPHAFFRRFRSDGRSVSSAVSPRITVIMRPCLRFSTAIRAVCFPGGVRIGASGGQVHSDSGFSHRSQCGGRSNFVPVNSPILESLLRGILCPRTARIVAKTDNWFWMTNTILNSRRFARFAGKLLFRAWHRHCPAGTALRLVRST